MQYNLWSVWNIFWFVLIILVIVKFISPRVTLRSSLRMFFRVLYWPIRASWRLVRKEYSSAQAETIPEDQQLIRRRSRKKV